MLIHALCAITAAIGLLLAFRYFRQARHLGSIPTARVRSAPQGYVELRGVARSLMPIPYRTPHTHIPCVWFEYCHRHANGDHSELEVRRSEQSFLLEDDSGICRIDPLTMQIETRSRINNWLNKISLTSSEGMVSLRWIGIGEEIHAYGKFTTLRRDVHGQRDDLIRSRLQALKHDRETMRRFDDDGDGIVSADEWQQAREFIIDGVDDFLRAKQRQFDDDTPGHVLRAPGDERLPYLVSSFREPRTIRRYRRLAFAWLLLFLLCGGLLVEGQLLDALGNALLR